MTHLSDLDELDLASEMIHYRLVSRSAPPFDGDVIFPAGAYYPEWRRFSRELTDLRIPGFFLRREMEVAFESSRLDGQPEFPVQKLNKTVQAVVRCLIAAIDKWIGAFDFFDCRILLLQGGNIGIVYPKVGATGPHVGEKSARVTAMQVPHRRSQHDNVAGRVLALENELSHFRRITAPLKALPSRKGGLLLTSHPLRYDSTNYLPHLNRSGFLS